MIDIESTGIDSNVEDLLQIGVVEVNFVDGFWKPCRTFEHLCYTWKNPESEFAKTHMAGLYARCQTIDQSENRPELIRSRLLNFFKSCGAVSPEVYFMGWNASNFDIPFLVAKSVLRPSKYVTGDDGKDVMVGDFHYRIYEMGGAVALAADVIGVSKARCVELIKEALAAYPEIDLPNGAAHDAIYDCYKQIRILNGLIRMVSSQRAAQPEVQKLVGEE
jgi:hypothetical protein